MGRGCGRLDLVLAGAPGVLRPGCSSLPGGLLVSAAPLPGGRAGGVGSAGPFLCLRPSAQGLLFPGLLALPVSGSVDCRPTAPSDPWSPPGGLTRLTGEGGGPPRRLISLVSLVQPPQAGQARVASSGGSPDSTGCTAQASPRPCPQSALLGTAAQRLRSPGGSPASAVLPHEPWSRPSRPSRLDTGLALPPRA